MHILFVHQNFPAQFRYIAPRLVHDYGCQCTFVTERQEGALPGVEKVVYRARGGATSANHPCTRNFENAVGQTHGVYEALKARPDIRPDLVVAHTGFGSSLFLPYLYDAPIINFLELFYHTLGGDLGFRPELPVRELSLLRLTTKNAMILLDLESCDRGWVPTHYQKNLFPKPYHDKIEAIFDGIDTDVYHRKDNPARQIGKGPPVDPNCRIVTYVARGFELMRGFDIFMKAAKLIYEQFPNVIFVVVGSDNIHYGPDQEYFKTKSFRHYVLGQDNYDLSKFRFTGYVPQETLADILSISDLHIYLTQPFIASWSMVDAMACGAVVLASDQVCTREYIVPGQNGLLCDFFEYEGLARQAVEVLKDPPAFQHLAQAARRAVEEKYSLKVAMPRLHDFFQRVAAKPRSPSIRADLLVRPGTLATAASAEPDEELRDSDSGSSSNLRPLPEPAAPTVVTAPPPATDEPLPEDPKEMALALVRRLSASTRPRTPADWVAATQSFRAPAPVSRLGPPNHPTDLARLLQRVMQWKPGLVVDLGTGDGGTLFLWTRVASPQATLIAAALPGKPYPADKIPFLQAMARPKQAIRCIPSPKDHEELARAVDESCNGKKIDFLFMHGLRSYPKLRADFRHYRNRVRKGGLIAWDGVDPVVPLDMDNEGGHRLWAEVKPMYSFHAEYLAGRTSTIGGIVAIRV